MSSERNRESVEESWVTTVGSPVRLRELIHDYPALSEVDIIGDVHGCLDELVKMIHLLGHGHHLEGDHTLDEPAIILVGDLVDRGDRNIGTLRRVIDLCRRGIARSVIGNHDFRFLRWLKGENVALTHGLAETVAEFEQLDGEERETFRREAITFYESLPSVIRFDGGKGTVVHAAWRPTMKVEENWKRIFYYAMYGPTTGETTPEGYPIRLDWASRYRGPEHAIFGHQVYDDPYLNPFATGIDTGCVFGGALTALRWPDMSLVSVESRFARAEYGRPPIAS